MLRTPRRRPTLLLLGSALVGCHPTVGDDSAAPAPLAAHILAGPADEGYDADLAALVEAHDRVLGAIGSAPYAMALDAAVPDRAAIDGWSATGSGYTPADFEAQTGETVMSQVSAYHEMGDLGMFGGVAGVGTACKYALLRDDPGASPESVDDARAAFVGLLGSLHAMVAITGGAVLVRGLAPADMPGMEGVTTTPLTDADGNPDPADKSAVFREDYSGDYPGWYWIDDTSKDQFTGYIAALGTSWEVGRDDPDIDPALITDLVDDARLLGDALQVPSPDTGLDLSLMDADGRPTTFHDLNARELEGAVADEDWNASNAMLALGGLRVLASVSGDAGIADFYHAVAEDRGYADLTAKAASFTYFNQLTNYSDVNMMLTAEYSWCHFEQLDGTSPDLVDACAATAASLFAPGVGRAPAEFADGWFTFIVAALAAPTEDGVDQDDLDLATANLAGFHPAPYWHDAVENCDTDEIAAGSCLAVDGVTVIPLAGSWGEDGFEPSSSRNEDLYSSAMVPQALRPPSDFEWRSDPYRVNGGGGQTLDPAGDLHAAYWLGRWLRLGPAFGD